MLKGGWICYEIYYQGCWICSEIRYKGLGYATRYDPTGHTCCMINSLGGLMWYMIRYMGGSICCMTAERLTTTKPTTTGE